MLNKKLLVIFWLFLSFSTVVNGEVYLTQDAFLEKYFIAKPKAEFLWLDKELRNALKNDLQENINTARLRYWQLGEKRAWILEKVGRDKPITLGFILENGKIIHMDVLVFRESRGYEIHYESFTRQLENVALGENKELEKSIDNITGATLSVNAVRKTARLALYLDNYLQEQINNSHDVEK